jgi:Peptidase M50B-like
VTGAFITVLAPDPQPSAAQTSAELAASTALLALLMVTILWPVAKYAVTIAHEGGHALTASAVGRSLKSVSLSRDGSGLTSVAGGSRLTYFPFLLAGYLGPSIFGLLGAILVAQGQSRAVLLLSLALLVLLLLHVTNIFGFIAVMATGGIILLAARYGTDFGKAIFAYTWIWLLLIGGVRQAIELGKSRKRAGVSDTVSDAYQLRKLTYIPAPLWTGLFAVGAVAALILGAAILLGVVGQPID